MFCSVYEWCQHLQLWSHRRITFPVLYLGHSPDHVSLHHQHCPHPICSDHMPPLATSTPQLYHSRRHYKTLQSTITHIRSYTWVKYGPWKRAVGMSSPVKQHANHQFTGNNGVGQAIKRLRALTVFNSHHHNMTKSGVIQCLATRAEICHPTTDCTKSASTWEPSSTQMIDRSLRKHPKPPLPEAQEQPNLHLSMSKEWVKELSECADI